MAERKTTAAQRAAATIGLKSAAPQKRAPASDVTSPALPRPWYRPNTPEHLQDWADWAESDRAAEFAGPAFYNPAKLNAVRQARGGAPKPFPELQAKPAMEVDPISKDLVPARPHPWPSPPAVEPRTMQPLGGGLGFGPAGSTAFAADMMPQGQPPVAFAAEMMAPPSPLGTAAQKAAQAIGVPGYQAQPRQSASERMAKALGVDPSRLKAPGERGSAGVMTMDARRQAMQESDQMQLPPQTRRVVEQQILAGDFAAAGRAQQLLASLPPGALAAGREQTIDRQLAAQVQAGGQGVRDKQAEDRTRYSATARANTEKASASSRAAIALGLDPLASPGQMQQARARALSQADTKSLEALAAQGDPMAAAALQGNTPAGFVGPLAPGQTYGVRAREQAAEKAKLDEAAKRDLTLYNTRYVLPKRIEQETARFKESGLDRRAWMKVDPRTGKSSSVSADQIMRSYQTALKVYADVHGSDDGFPNVEAWARQQGISYGPQGYKLGPQAGADLGGSPAGPEQPGGAPAFPGMDWVQQAVQQTTQQAMQQNDHVASLNPAQRAKWDRLTPDQQHALLMQVSSRTP